MASKLKPDESYPKNKLVEIENQMVVIRKQEAEQKKKDEAYNKVMAEGETFYSNSDYPSAIASFRNASNIKPDEALPKKRIFDIQEELKNQNKKQLEEIDFANKAVAEKYLSELARKYPEGITEENYDATGGKKIKRIIVNRSGVANDYREVTHNWGGVYYFKNGQSISKFLFSQETTE
jgi:ribosomal protein S18